MHKQSKSSGLPEIEAQLVKAAIQKVRSIPLDLDDENYLIRLFTIRNGLGKAIQSEYDPSKNIKQIFWFGLTLSLISASAVTAVGIWRALARFDSPIIQQFDEPVMFILLLTGLFILSWVPLLIAQIRTSRLKRLAKHYRAVKPANAFKVFDLAVVKGLLKAGEAAGDL
jgi:hypothetical protein